MIVLPDCIIDVLYDHGYQLFSRAFAWELVASGCHFSYFSGLWRTKLFFVFCFFRFFGVDCDLPMASNFLSTEMASVDCDRVWLYLEYRWVSDDKEKKKRKKKKKKKEKKRPDSLLGNLWSQYQLGAVSCPQSWPVSNFVWADTPQYEESMNTYRCCTFSRPYSWGETKLTTS